MQRPWNLPDLPVYSLATYGDTGVNMNICTYVSAVSMQPKLYAIAVFKGTYTLHRLSQHTIVVLQLLGADQYKLVRYLGKQSGRSFNKEDHLAERNLLTRWNGFTVLSDTAAWLEMRALDCRETGDHCLYTFQVQRYRSNHMNILTTGLLKSKGIIRA